MFEDPNGVRISYGVEIFRNGSRPQLVGSGYEVDSNSYMLNSPLGVDQQFVTKAHDSASATGTPWLGWQHFEWSISQAQFVAALDYLVAHSPSKVQLTYPTQYMLVEMHLNAEFHFQPDPAELGWSMHGWKVWIPDRAADLASAASRYSAQPPSHPAGTRNPALLTSTHSAHDDPRRRRMTCAKPRRTDFL